MLSHLNIFTLGSGHIISKTGFVQHFIPWTDHHCSLLMPTSQWEVLLGSGYCLLLITHFSPQSPTVCHLPSPSIATALRNQQKLPLGQMERTCFLFVALPESFHTVNHLPLPFRPPQSLASLAPCDHFFSWEVLILSGTCSKAWLLSLDIIFSISILP